MSKLIKISNSLLLLFLFNFSTIYSEEISVIVSKDAPARISFGAERIILSLQKFNYKTQLTYNQSFSAKNFSIIVCEWNDEAFSNIISASNVAFDSLPGKEGFEIRSAKNHIIIRGNDASGALYGCLELADQIEKNGTIPLNFKMSDHPEMVLRGACIGLQKTTYLPGRDVYEYPYTPENFPWFYDSTLWVKYLDMLLENRMNALYLWNGHPFASLVKLKDYPYAVEVDDATFRKNEQIFSFITTEADKRGIWVIQMFYNIIVSKPFAEHNNLKTQDRSRPIITIISDYTRKSVTAFVEKYPNVGLMVCLGEAIDTEDDDVKWFTETIIPGIKDGLTALGSKEEPPLILRAHDTNCQLVMKSAMPLYKNLYTESKYNGESLTTYTPGGPWTETHQQLSKIGTVHISNVHILANLEPFRYGSPEFIRKSVLAMRHIQGADGLHLYPQASYWDWPYTADNTSPRLYEMDRDWIWYKAWARYAWKSDYDSTIDKKYWFEKLEDYFGCTGYGNNIKKAYDESGEIAPKLLRRFGITDGNRQTLLLGMFMSQLTNPYKWRVYKSFYESNGPQGEIIIDFVKKEWNKELHQGETPNQIIGEVLKHAKNAVINISSADKFVTKNRNEFERLKNDILCYELFAKCFAEKVEAALLVVRYKYSNSINDLESALPHVEKSLEYYKQLVSLTEYSYLYANSMQTQQRRIPIAGNDGNYKTWKELLPKYKEEYENFKKNIAILKTTNAVKKVFEPFKPAELQLLDTSLHLFPIQKGEKIYNDDKTEILEFAPELSKLHAIRLNSENQKNKGTSIRFYNNKPVKVVVGYFNGNSLRLLNPPGLETNANANSHGQADIKIANAISLNGLFPVNIYTYSFDAGDNILELGKGMVLILGFIDGSQEIVMRDAGFSGKDDNGGIDWMFY